MLEIKKMSKSIKDKTILNEIDIRVDSGHIYGLLGPNGAGKTTTFYIIAGLINCENGQHLSFSIGIGPLETEISFRLWLMRKNK